jgi:uncharacterized protein YbjT (DUF2867 family)
MKILVTNPTGIIGRRILPHLLAPEVSVRVVARNPRALPEAVREQVEIVRGSTDDATALRQALDGVEALFWCVPTESLQETKVEQHYERFACAGWTAIREVGTPRVVTVSAVGKGRARRAGPISGLHAMEDILDESGAAIRHLRCGLFMENFLREAEWLIQRDLLSYPVASHFPLPLVAAEDIADIALRFLVRRDWSGIAGVAVHGPEDLSFGEAAAIIGRVLARPVRYEQMSPTQYVQKMVSAGASVEYARSLVAMYAELAQGISQAEPRTVESTTRTTLAKWSARELLPVAQTLHDESRSESLPLADTWQPATPVKQIQLGA